MDNLPDLLRSYRAGQLDRVALVEQLAAAGFDPTDADLLADNQDFVPMGDMAERHIVAQQRRRKAQRNPLMP